MVVERAALRAAALGLLLSLPCAGLLGFLTGLVALPCGLLEGFLARRERRGPGVETAGVLGVWALALVGCTAAYLQAAYLQGLRRSGSIAAGASAALNALQHQVLRPEEPSVTFYLLCAALAFALAASLRLGGDWRPPLCAVLGTGCLASLCGPRSFHGVLDWCAAVLFLAPCLAAGALPGGIGLFSLYAALDWMRGGRLHSAAAGGE